MLVATLGSPDVRGMILTGIIEAAMNSGASLAGYIGRIPRCRKIREAQSVSSHKNANSVVEVEVWKGLGRPLVLAGWEKGFLRRGGYIFLVRPGGVGLAGAARTHVVEPRSALQRVPGGTRIKTLSGWGEGAGLSVLWFWACINGKDGMGSQGCLPLGALYVPFSG